MVICICILGSYEEYCSQSLFSIPAASAGDVLDISARNIKLGKLMLIIIIRSRK